MRKIKWSWLGIIATLFCLSGGGALAFFLTATPEQQGLSWRNKPKSIVPVTLDRPVNVLVLGIDNSGHPHSGKNYTPSEAPFHG